MRSPSIVSSRSTARIDIAQACATGACSASSDGDDFIIGQVVVYHLTQFGHTFYMPAIYNGPCPDQKHGHGRVSIIILWRGLPKRMDWVKRSQVMSLEDYWKMSGRIRA